MTADGKGLPKYLRVAAAIQLYHHHTMVHDDVYDEDTARRRWPTTHVAFADWTFSGVVKDLDIFDPETPAGTEEAAGANGFSIFLESKRGGLTTVTGSYAVTAP